MKLYQGNEETLLFLFKRDVVCTGVLDALSFLLCPLKPVAHVISSEQLSDLQPLTTPLA